MSNIAAVIFVRKVSKFAVLRMGMPLKLVPLANLLSDSQAFHRQCSCFQSLWDIGVSIIFIIFSLLFLFLLCPLPHLFQCPVRLSIFPLINWLFKFPLLRPASLRREEFGGLKDVDGNRKKENGKTISS